MQLAHPNLDQMQSMINQRDDLRPCYWQLMKCAIMSIDQRMYYDCTHTLSIYMPLSLLH